MYQTNKKNKGKKWKDVLLKTQKIVKKYVGWNLQKYWKGAMNKLIQALIRMEILEMNNKYFE